MQWKHSSSPSLSIRVNITVTLQTVTTESLALASGIVGPCCSPGGSGGGRWPFHSFLSFSWFLSSPLEALPTCVMVWSLSACLLQSAEHCSRPHPSSLAPASLRIPTDPPPPPPPPLGPPGQEQLFQNWPHMCWIFFLLLLLQSLSSAASTSTLFSFLLQRSL